MRPGYTLILEWGWNPFIDNDGEMSNWDYMDNLFDPNQKIGKINLKNWYLMSKTHFQKF